MSFFVFPNPKLKNWPKPNPTFLLLEVLCSFCSDVVNLLTVLKPSSKDANKSSNKLISKYIGILYSIVSPFFFD